MKWQIVKLQSLASDEKSSIVSGPFGSNISAKYFVDEGVPVIRGNNLTKGEQKFIDDGFVYLTEAKAAEFRNCIAIKDDLVFTAAGSIGQIGIIPDNTKFKKYVISNKQLRVRINEKKAIPLFVYYWLSTPKMTSYLEGMNNGGAVPLLNLGIIRKVPVPLPPLDTQNNICAIISNLNDLIDINRRRIRLLEEAARLLFREWFVYFRFPGHGRAKMVDGMPEGWQKKQLIEVAQIQGGKQYPHDEFLDKGSYPVFGGNGIQGYSNDCTHKGFVIAFGRVGINCGSIHWAYNGAWINNNASSVIPNNHNEFYLQYLLQVNFSNLRKGAAQPFIPNGILNSLKLLIPSDTLADEFCRNIYGIRRQQSILTIQNSKLTQARDLILPRLMSGKIVV